MRKLSRKALREMADLNGLVYKPGAKKPVLHISDDGTITRAYVRLDLCKAMSLAEATKTLWSK